MGKLKETITEVELLFNDLRQIKGRIEGIQEQINDCADGEEFYHFKKDTLDKIEWLEGDYSQSDSVVKSELRREMAGAADQLRMELCGFVEFEAITSLPVETTFMGRDDTETPFVMFDRRSQKFFSQTRRGESVHNFTDFNGSQKFGTVTASGVKPRRTCLYLSRNNPGLWWFNGEHLVDISTTASLGMLDETE
ncbi:MAG: hypothetical protein NC204_05775 [Candidatus Amulumruptor caecigallinarius]|nr:hypothetical protein [Candidatus Amulumruptor caecigallinarius]